MACIGKDDDGQIGEKRDRPRPLDQRDISSILESVSLDEVEQDQDDKVANGDEGDEAGVFERVQSPQE
jgi:hypothetical protein